MNENFTSDEEQRVTNAITQLRNDAIRSYLILNVAIGPLIVHDKPIPTLPAEFEPMTISQILSPHKIEERIYRLQLAQEYQLSLLKDVNISFDEYSKRVVEKVKSFYVGIDEITSSISSCWSNNEDCDEEVVAKMYFVFYKRLILYMKGLVESGTYLTSVQPKLQQAIMNYEESERIVREEDLDTRTIGTDTRDAISIYNFYNMKVNTREGEMRTIDMLRRSKESVEAQLSSLMVSNLQSKIVAETCREKGKKIAENLDRYDSDGDSDSGMRGGNDITDPEMSSSFENGFIIPGEDGDEISIVSDVENDDMIDWGVQANNLEFALDDTMESVADSNSDMSFGWEEEEDEPWVPLFGFDDMGPVMPELLLEDLVGPDPEPMMPALALEDLVGPDPEPMMPALALEDLEITPPPLTLEDLAPPSFDEGHTTRDTTASFMSEEPSTLGTETLAWMSPDNSMDGDR
jgi:hypothetical protein